MILLMIWHHLWIQCWAYQPKLDKNNSIFSDRSKKETLDANYVTPWTCCEPKIPPERSCDLLNFCPKPRLNQIPSWRNTLQLNQMYWPSLNKIEPHFHWKSAVYRILSTMPCVLCTWYPFGNQAHVNKKSWSLKCKGDLQIWITLVVKSPTAPLCLPLCSPLKYAVAWGLFVAMMLLSAALLSIW